MDRCNIAECENKRIARGFCSKHYQRLVKYGDANYKVKHQEKHGMTHTHKRELHVWQGMKKRCYDPNHPRYKNYGGRGITVYPEWRKSFKAFIEYMGERPEGLTLDRIDNDGNYEPGNVRWATYYQQNENRSNVKRYKGLTRRAWAEKLKIHLGTYKAYCVRYGDENAVKHYLKLKEVKL